MSVLGSSSKLPPNDRQLELFQRYVASVLPDSFLVEPKTSYLRLIYGIYYGVIAQRYPEFLADADRIFADTVQLAPGKAETYFEWGKMYARLGQIEPAIAKFEQALVLEPLQRDITYEIGVWLISLNRRDEGNALIQRSIDLGREPKFSDIKKLADALEKVGDIDRVEKMYFKIIEEQRNLQETVYAVTALVEVYRRAGRLSEALELAKSLAQYPINMSAYDQLINSLTNPQ